MKTTGSDIKRKNRPIVFDMTSNLCVWANTGLLPPSPCINAFNCLDCPVDKKMQTRVLKKGLATGPARDLDIPLHKKIYTVPHQTEVSAYAFRQSVV